MIKLITGNKNCFNFRPDDNRLEKNPEINRISYRQTKTTTACMTVRGLAAGTAHE